MSNIIVIKDDIAANRNRWCSIAPTECSCRNGQCKNGGTESKKNKK